MLQFVSVFDISILYAQCI